METARAARSRVGSNRPLAFSHAPGAQKFAVRDGEVARDVCPVADIPYHHRTQRNVTAVAQPQVIGDDGAGSDPGARADLDVPVDNRSMADMCAGADLDVMRDKGGRADTHVSAHRRVLPEDPAGDYRIIENDCAFTT